MLRAFVLALRARGVDVLTAREADMIERSDEEQLAFAASAGRVICTFNVGDFYRLHAEYLRVAKTHAGMLLMPQQRYAPGELARRVTRLVGALSAEDMDNRVEFLSSWEPS